MQLFDNDQLHCITKAQIKQQVLRDQIHAALYNNTFNKNFIISSPPGLGKTYEMNDALAKNPIPNVLRLNGNGSMPGFIIDEYDLLFADKHNLNISKKMLDETRTLSYGKLAKNLKGLCTPLQYEAVESFCKEDKVGFDVPLHNATIICLTNVHFATVNEVNDTDPSSAKHARLTDLYAIRRRVDIEDIEMDDEILWGYIANVVMNEKICEKWKPNITEQEKGQLLIWCFTYWAKVSERNLSLAEKMTQDMVRYPTNYLNIWVNKYLQ
jgi:hypothetical protein